MWPEGAKSVTEVSRRPVTAGQIFKASMNELIDNLKQKVPFYVRCIKPNSEKSPAKFDEQVVSHQVEYLGLVENVRVRRAGFAYRAEYERFLKRYKMISGKTWPNYYGGGGSQMACREIVNEKGFDDDVKYGKTKLFIRSPQTIVKLEQDREYYLSLIIVLLQKVPKTIFKNSESVNSFFRPLFPPPGMARHPSAHAHEEDSRRHHHHAVLPPLQTAHVPAAAARHRRGNSPPLPAQPANHRPAEGVPGELAPAAENADKRGGHHSAGVPPVEGLAPPPAHSPRQLAGVPPEGDRRGGAGRKTGQLRPGGEVARQLPGHVGVQRGQFKCLCKQHSPEAAPRADGPLQQSHLQGVKQSVQEERRPFGMLLLGFRVFRSRL